MDIAGFHTLIAILRREEAALPEGTPADVRNKFLGAIRELEDAIDAYKEWLKKLEQARDRDEPDGAGAPRP